VRLNGGDKIICGVAHIAARLSQKAEAADPIDRRHAADASAKRFHPIDHFAVESLERLYELAPNMRLRFSVHHKLSLPLASPFSELAD